jgi:bacillithiol synthase
MERERTARDTLREAPVMAPVVRTMPLGGAPLALAAQRGEAPEWMPAAPRDPAWWRDAGAAAAARFQGGAWLRALQPALPMDGPSLERLHRAAASGFLVTTGQQPGLFGGPMYTFSKALSALALADALERLCEVPVAPVFWAATDDADFEEAATTFLAEPGGVRRLSLTRSHDGDVPLRDVPLRDSHRLVDAVFGHTGAAVAPELRELARRCYSPEQTVGSAYIQLLRELLGGRGIAVVDGGHPEVLEQARPLMLHALERAGEIEQALTERGRLLDAAGYDSQVKHVPGLALVFSRENGRRRRVPIAEARQAHDADAHPLLSPNVLLRPLAERALMPTVAYVAGPGELAYFAQVDAVAAALDCDSAVAVPRWSGMIIEPHIQRILERYDLEPDDLLDPHAADMALARRSLPAAVREALAALRERVHEAVSQLEKAVHTDAQLPPTVFQGAERDILRRADRLERRIVGNARRRDESTAHDIATARAALYPNSQPQERVLNLLPILARHGLSLLDSMLARAAEHAAHLTGDLQSPHASVSQTRDFDRTGRSG